MTNQPLQLTSAEVDVLRMIAEETPMEYGAWVTVCSDFLLESGFIMYWNNEFILTKQGQMYLSAIDNL